VPFTPAGTIVATDTQAAVEELDADITGLADLSDDPYDPITWDGVTNEAATKNALRDAFESLSSVDDTAYNATTWDNDSTNAATRNALRDKFVSVDAAIPAAIAAVLDGETYTGTHDFGGATVELPNGNNPTVSAAGTASVDANDNSLRLYGSAERVIPDGVQAVSDAIPILTVESTWAPAGITIRDIYLKTSASSTYSINLEEWTSPTDGAPTTIEAVATSSTTEAEDDGTLADGAIAAGSLIFVDLPATAESWIQVTFTYTVNANN
jgi:hypothetical protein